MSKNDIIIAKTKFVHILLCAFRYSLGRTTYITSDCSSWLKRWWDILPRFMQEQIHDDIRKSIAAGHAGHQCDVDYWKSVLEKPIKKEGV